MLCRSKQQVNHEYYKPSSTFKYTCVIPKKKISQTLYDIAQNFRFGFLLLDSNLANVHTLFPLLPPVFSFAALIASYAPILPSRKGGF